MAVPPAISEALRPIDPASLPGRLADGSLACEGAKFHSPTPLVLHEIDIDGRTVTLCGTCWSNVAVLRALLSHHGELPWPVRREFGNKLRGLLIPKEEPHGG